MPGNYRTTNSNPNDPLFFATIIPTVGGTALGPALRNLGITTANFFGNLTYTPYGPTGGTFTRYATLSEGLYLVTGASTVKLYGNSGECAAANGSRSFNIPPNQMTFMPVKNPENLWIVGSAAGSTLGVRGH